MENQQFFDLSPSDAKLNDLNWNEAQLAVIMVSNGSYRILLKYRIGELLELNKF